MYFLKQITNIDKCTGCFACSNICPKKCIDIQEENNVLQAKINEEECIDCNSCIKICPAENEITRNEPLKLYAAWSLDENIRRTSSSGGIATQLYKTCLKNNWLVVGTKFDKDFNLNYEITDSIKDIENFKGSKYVQSKTNNIFPKIKAKLDEEKKILFIGLPCHIAGLKLYLKKEYINLITIDLICHGVSPNSYLKEHIKYIENKLKQKIENITFREDNKLCLKLYSKNKRVYENNSALDVYYRGYLTGLFYRPSCYNCKYANIKRVSDITLGDFWGLGDTIPFDKSTKDGVSLMLINTKKGEELIDLVKDNLFLEERTIEEGLEKNEQLSHPSKKNKNYDNFLKYIKKYDFEKATSKVLSKDINVIKVKTAIKKIIKR